MSAPTYASIPRMVPLEREIVADVRLFAGLVRSESDPDCASDVESELFTQAMEQTL